MDPVVGAGQNGSFLGPGPKTATRTEMIENGPKICGVSTCAAGPDSKIVIPQPPSFLF